MGVAVEQEPERLDGRMAGWLARLVSNDLVPACLPVCLPVCLSVCLPACPPTDVADAGHSEELRSLRHRPRNMIQTCFRAVERRCVAQIRWYSVGMCCHIRIYRTYYGGIAQRNGSGASSSASEDGWEKKGLNA